MTGIELYVQTSLAEIIRHALTLDTDDDDVRDGFPCVYSSADTDDFSARLTCLLGAHPTVVEGISVAQVVAALNHYDENDDFLEL